MSKKNTMINMKDYMEQDQILEAMDSEMRRVINFNTSMSNKETEVMQRRERREKADANRRMARRTCVAKKRANQQAFLIRNFGTVCIAALVSMASACGMLDPVLCVLLLCVAGMYLLWNFMAYCTRNQKPAEKEAEAVCALRVC